MSIDLTVRPPRSPRVRLGGYVILARMLDKGRAEIAGKNGEYHYNCPLDQHFLNFTGVTAEAISTLLKKGASDSEVLAYIEKESPLKRTSSEIYAWSQFHDQRSPSDAESLQWYAGVLGKIAPTREDVGTWFELLDVDDYVTFGGKA